MITELHRAARRIGVIALLLSTAFFAFGQVKKYPATINPIVGFPNSIYLNDYATPGSNLLQANVVFNDFNETSWTFRLRVKIESSSIRLQTFPDFRPATPIVLSPGIIQTFSGADWEPYFNYNGLSIAGSSVSELVNSGGRLPEGFYSFCFQVLDYDTGDPLSEEVCRTAWLKLVDAPRLNVPLCGTTLSPQLLQHSFAWQSFDTPSPTGEAPEFQLTIWEATEAVQNIQTAVSNGQALQIFQSPLTRFSGLNYGAADPPFELGKQYIFRVQAVDPSGRDKYKNQGYSEFCSFWYGWPSGGTITLQSPIDGGGFRKKDIPDVKWSAVTPKLPQQIVNYEITIAPWLEGQTREQAIQYNDPWFYFVTPATSSMSPQGKELPRLLQTMAKYAWQVKAFTDQQEIGKSKIGYFNGPSLMEEFWAGGHRVQVDYIDGVDLNDLSGGGKIRFSDDKDDWTPITFSHIQIEDRGDFFKMVGGEIFHAPQNRTVRLAPNHAPNGYAYYDIKQFRINKDGIYAEGAVRWALPFPVLTAQVATVRSETLWSNFNNFKINAAAKIAPGNTFDLLEPYNFTIDLQTSGIVYVWNGEYRFEFNGAVVLPGRVRSPLEENVRLPFSNLEQLFYVHQRQIQGSAHAINLLTNTNLDLIVRDYTLDLSESVSPTKFAPTPGWKGVYINEFDVAFHNAIDGKGQFSMTEAYIARFDQTSTPSIDAWVTPNGLDVKLDYEASTNVAMVFQTFPSSLRQFKIHIQESQVLSEESFLRGGFYVPVVSTEKQFGFRVPVSNVGFQDGYLEDLVDTKFTHNPGAGDQEISFTITRAVLTGYEKVSMTLEMEWHSMGVTLKDLRGFNAWGDYSIGFDSKNGTVPLVRQYNANLSNYPVTISVIGAGSNNGRYIFATTADAGLGDDVGGGEGAPSVNLYSVMANQFVPAEAAGQLVATGEPTVSLEQASETRKQEFQQFERNLLQKLDSDPSQLIAEAEDLKNSLAGNTSQVYSAEEMVGNSPGDATTDAATGGGRFNSQQREIIDAIVTGFVEEMSKPLLSPLQKKTDSLSIAVANQVNRLVDKAGEKVDRSVDAIVSKVAEELIRVLSNDKVDVEGPIRELASRTTQVITAEVKSSLKTTTDENIIQPVQVLLKDKVYGRINKHITENTSQIIYTAITADGDPKDALKNLVTDAPKVIADALKDVVAFVSVDNIRSTIEGTADDFVKNISVKDIQHELGKAAGDIFKAAVNKELNKALGNLAEQYAADLGLGEFGLGGENPINFVGVAQRFKEDGIKGVFAVDPVRVKLNTPVIQLDGFIKYTPKHPTYGDVWLGDIDMLIKVPKKFKFNALYFNGKKEEINYWFCQITPPDGSNELYELGKPLPKTAKPLNEPVNIGAAKIVGASGRLYHHMAETAAQGIVPDASMRYGAYMHFVFFDAANAGQNLRLEVSGEINSRENGDYTIAFDGNLQIRSGAPKILEIDRSAEIQGTVKVRYNSAEEHFFGYAQVIVKTESLCAEASLLVDVKPGKWRVAIGTREERVIFVPGCVGFSPTGWLDLNQNSAELGLGLQLSGSAKSPKLNIGVFAFYTEVSAGIAAGIIAEVQYNPKLQLNKAGIWVDIWADIIAHYKLGIIGKWKSKTIVEIYIRGDLLIIFNPPPTVLEGNLRGTVKIVSFKVNFNASMRKQL